MVLALLNFGVAEFLLSELVPAAVVVTGRRRWPGSDPESNRQLCFSQVSLGCQQQSFSPHLGAHLAALFKMRHGSRL